MIYLILQQIFALRHIKLELFIKYSPTQMKYPNEDPAEDFDWDPEEDSDIYPRDIMGEDPDCNPRRDELSR